jgi:hypothetical protein
MLPLATVIKDTKTVLLILTLGFLSCLTENSLEKQLYDCWNQSFKENEVDFDLN